MSDTKKLRNKFEEEIQNQKSPAGGTKQRVWTPQADDEFRVQSKVKVVHPSGPPPKKSISQLP